MNYIKEKQSYYKKNKLIVKVMLLYIDDYDFLYQCIGLENNYVAEEVEDIIVTLIDLQGDNVHYVPLCIA